MRLSQILHRLAEICEERPSATIRELEAIIAEDETLRQE